MKSIIEKQEEIKAEFELFGDWTEKYDYIIDIGKTLPAMSDEFKTDQNLIEGCQSKVWLHAKLENGIVYFSGDSDAIITKGIVGLLLRIFSESSPSEIMNADLSVFEATGLQEHLSPTRANGLQAMIKQMKLYGLAFQTKMNS
ncbi:MAG: SufE family protein [Bacteroidota bacterium]